ncbi:hypothetical protein LTR53_011931 [Teratosphaeriaceae sp. CCFEE 6253]|nr:hypothetical protein LTR53_011931 [Teratosphaeriaceae sp. CCFEE 6253]
MASFYEILGLDRHMSHKSVLEQRIKAAYHTTLLKHHPDRQETGRPAPSSGAPSVDEIVLAYKTLSDPERRAEYDRSLDHPAIESPARPHGRGHHTGLDTVDLDSLAFAEQTQTWSRACRCGERQGFVVTESELEQHAENGEIMVGCKGCSLWLRVLFGEDEPG